MGLFDSFFKSNEKKPNEHAVGLANQFVDAFNNRDMDRINDLAEDMVEMAGFFLQKYDTESYTVLLNAAKETSYMYSGSKYRRDLLEDIIREQARNF